MNRRSFLTKSGLVLATASSFAGCSGGGSQNGDGNDENDDTTPEEPDIPVNVTTTDNFDESATYDSVRLSGGPDENVGLSLVVTPKEDYDCLDIGADYQAFDSENVAIETDEENIQSYDGAKKRFELSFSRTADELGKIEIELNSLRGGVYC
jgi:hypothetical protein